MPFQAGIAAGVLALLAATAPAAAKDACEKSLVHSQTFWDAMDATLPVEIGEGEVLKPTTKPPQPPEFLDLAQKVGFEGKVIVLLVVAGDGSIADRVILCADPFGYFEPEVLDWAKGYRFAPLVSATPGHYRRYQIHVSFKFHDSSPQGRPKP